MFGGFPFGNDPFGGMRHHMRMMDDMMRDMMFPFGSPHPPHSGYLEHPNQPPPRSRDPFNLMVPSPMRMFDGMMNQVRNLHAMSENDPNSHVFSHSTMITFDGSSGSQPRVVERTMRKTGDVKETRQSLRTGTEGGIGDRMSIEHAIGKRAHLIEKERDRSGRIRERQKFKNLDQVDAEDFDREFMNRASRNIGGRSNIRAAIEHGRSKKPATHRVYQEAVENAPIVTLPDDDDDEDEDEDEDVIDVGTYRSHKNYPSTSRYGRHSRPTIEELIEDDSDRKKRKGPLGKLFKTAED